MTQSDYILRMIEQASRVMAQIMWHKQQRDYPGAHNFIDEQFKIMLGMGAGFIHSAPEETLLAMLTTAGELDTEKCWLLATLLKAEGDLYSEQEDYDNSYYSYLKSLDLFLEVLASSREIHHIDAIPEVEGLLYKLSDYELPRHSKELLFRYFEQSYQFSKAEDTLYELLDADPYDRETIESGKAFYRRLLRQHDSVLALGSLSRDEVEDGLMKLMRR